MSHPMMSIQAATPRYYRKERGPKTGHYKQEGIIIKPSGSRIATIEVAVNS